MVVTATVAIAPEGASAATVSPPKISTQYTPNQIAVGQTAGITYTITNPNASGSLYQIAFIDTLPSTTTIDNPASVTNSGCGSAVNVAAIPGASSVTANGIVVKAGTPCVIQAAIDGNTAGTASDAYSEVQYTSSSASYAIPSALPTTDETPAALQVLGVPTVSVTTPKPSGAVYSFGQVVKAKFACAAAAGDDPSQLTCIGIDDLGNTINSGQKLDTTVAGKHQLDVEAISGITGATTDVTVNYTVKPDNVFTLTKVKPLAHGALSFTLGLPGAGKIALLEIVGKKTVATKTVTAGGAKRLTETVYPTPAGLGLFKNGALKVTLKVTFTPKGGVARTLTEGGVKLK